MQHKQTKALYALKYINKARVSKQRAVNNVSPTEAWRDANGADVSSDS